MSKNPMAPYVSYIQWAEACIADGMTYDEYVVSAKENDKVVLNEHEYTQQVKVFIDHQREYMGDE